MIDNATIDRIINAAPIEQVVAEFVTLKRRGANYMACCPFHNEKTPSFSVSPAKGIFKCFGCGKAGNVIRFIMEHEQLSYIEAVKFLGNKYNIPVDDHEETAEQAAVRLQRDSMMVVNAYAQEYYTRYLWEDPEGQSVGLGYFRERGFTDAIIRQFQLGFAPNKRDAFSRDAIAKGYKANLLTATGLTIHYPAQESKPETWIDRYQDRVMFPIHSISGRVIAFGGRTLRQDKQLAKYINSPESEIYVKSRSLYGIYFAKQAITRLQKCYLVEGYTDVISLFQAGIQNVVASSGTSLTTDQIRLIKRFTPNVTVLYDGDNAGIKASFRGIDMLLDEGLQVKVVRFPASEDPDSFARSHSASETQAFLTENETDFIHFKIDIYADQMSDPIKRSGVVREVVNSIALVPDAITRSVYISACSRQLALEEELLTREVAKIRKKHLAKRFGTAPEPFPPVPIDDQPLPQEPVSLAQAPTSPSPNLPSEISQAERNILYYLIKYGCSAMEPDQPTTVASFIMDELNEDELEFQTPAYLTLFRLYYALTGDDDDTRTKSLINHADVGIAQQVVDLLNTPYPITIKRLRESLPLDQTLLKEHVSNAVLIYKSKVVSQAYMQLTKQLQQAQLLGDNEQMLLLMKQLNTLMDVRNSFAKELNRLNS